MFFGCVFFFYKQKTAYEMRISDWSSDVCSSDLFLHLVRGLVVDLAGVEVRIGLDLPADYQPLEEQCVREDAVVVELYGQTCPVEQFAHVVQDDREVVGLDLSAPHAHLALMAEIGRAHV